MNEQTPNHAQTRAARVDMAAKSLKSIFGQHRKALDLHRLKDDKWHSKRVAFDGIPGWLAQAERDGGDLYVTLPHRNDAALTTPRYEDVTATDLIWVEVDPADALWRDGAWTQADARQTFERAFHDRLTEIEQGKHKNVPKPTFVWFSGRGFWLAYRIGLVKEPEKLAQGGAANLIQIGLANWWTSGVLKGDTQSANVNKVGRIPYTINSKTDLTGSLILEEPRRLYDLSDFESFRRDAQATQLTQKLTPAKTEAVGVSIDPTTAGRIEDLEAFFERLKLAPRWRTVIVQGKGDEEHEAERRAAGKDMTRSGWLRAALVALAGADATDNEMYAIITDPTVGIADSVLKTKKGKRLSRMASHNYAVRQIAGAKAWAETPELAEMNATRAVIESVGGKCVVLHEKFDPGLGEDLIEYQSFADIKNAFNNQKVQVGTNPKSGDPVYAPKGQWWLDQEKRRQYSGITFAPAADAPEVVNGYYNLWKGFDRDPAPGSWDLYHAHLREVICHGIEERAEYFLNWWAWKIVNPGGLPETNIVLRGDRGAGKGTLMKPFRSIFGRHYYPTGDMADLLGDFNGHLELALIVFLDEAVASGSARAAAQLKYLTTEAKRTNHIKNVTKFQIPNRLGIVLSTNNGWAIPAGPYERRIFALDVSSEHAGPATRDNPYFQKLHAQLDSGGTEALMFDLQMRGEKLLKDGWHPRYDVPRTAMLTEQIERSATPELSWLIDLAEAGALPGSPIQALGSEYRFDRPNVGRSKGLGTGWFDDFSDYCKDNGFRVSTSKQFGHFITKYGWGGSDDAEARARGDRPIKPRIGLEGEQVRLRRAPRLQDLRARLDRELGNREWTNPESDWTMGGGDALPF